jgi:dTDP-4-dehydrorhamnose 3,5-epimerase
VPEFHQTTLPGVVLVEPKVFGDDRGFFMESFNARDFKDAGLPSDFVQDNHSRSAYGVLRGLHYQYPTWQGKLVRCIKGEVFDVAVDIRRNSPYFGQWVGVPLTESNRHQLYIPPGFAHGFCVTSDSADVLYKCTTLYSPQDDGGIAWDDPDIGVEWPVSNPVLSGKDAHQGRLRDLKLDAA